MLCSCLSGFSFLGIVWQNVCSHQNSTFDLCSVLLGPQSPFTERVHSVKSCDREGSRAREAGEGGSRLCCIVSISVWKNDGDALRLVEVKELVTVSIGLRCLSMGEESVVGLLQPGWLTEEEEGGVRSVEGVFTLLSVRF